ncbi:helix-turn-helix transcriptional regulator [Myceligenerans crystallogenes]|uniref:HTH cro/C1-type domain-containing protein n=1 Tax=Myceligenerans crystallogenes TaxID=316335 RepID=A0ABN2NAZ3_9MICO
MTTQLTQQTDRPGTPGEFGTTPEPLLRDLVGRILRRTRMAQRRTLADVATDARVSTAYLSEVERGRKEASSEVLAAVCAALGMKLADLVERAWADLALASAKAEEERRVRVLSSRNRAGVVAPQHGSADLTRLPSRTATGSGTREAVLLAA